MWWLAAAADAINQQRQAEENRRQEAEAQRLHDLQVAEANRKPQWLIDYETILEKERIKEEEEKRIEEEQKQAEIKAIEDKRLATVWTSQNILEEILKKFKK